ncbi:MAG: metallophosphoesterase [Cyanobacteria bacterium P01_G01_bin.54]
MKILLIGDIHGRVYHLISIVNNILRTNDIDFILQLGDFGYHLNESQLDETTKRFAKGDRSQLHTLDYFNQTTAQNQRYSQYLTHLNQPIHFIEGNHECNVVLSTLKHYDDPLPQDALGLFKYIPNGHAIAQDGVKMTFLGGWEHQGHYTCSDGEIDPQQFQGQTTDILFTHDGPYGIQMGFRGRVQGSRILSEILKVLQPKLHFHGHYHTTTGPNRIHQTRSQGLAVFMRPLRDTPAMDINPGSMGVLDTAKNEFYYIIDEQFQRYRRADDVETILSTRLDLNLT